MCFAESRIPNFSWISQHSYGNVYPHVVHDAKIELANLQGLFTNVSVVSSNLEVCDPWNLDCLGIPEVVK